MTWYAHPSDLLEEHLQAVGAKADAFAAAFDAGDWGRCAGLLHDVGKSCDDFQRRLGGDDEISLDHAIGGARIARERLGPLGRLLAYAIAGHHGGLPDAGRLEARLGSAPAFDVEAIPALPSLPLPGKDLKGLGAALFIRMVFSCLVDADFLATESVLRPHAAPDRGIPFDAAALLDRLKAHVERLPKRASAGLDHLRGEIFTRCLEQGETKPPGLFSLTVPTGGGKTLASLGFALAHARRWGMSRVIMVAPYTGIIEQTARIYGEALGPGQVLEHHSNFRAPEDGGEQDSSDRRKLDLAEENWDAPVVVTTAVQFFESLFAHRPSRCRKLHNIAKAVIVLDEAQLLPLRLLDPCLEALRLLAASYGCSIVLCTATQPALGDADWLARALTGVTEIMGETGPKELHLQLGGRVIYHWQGSRDDAWVAGQLEQARQSMAVVNTRAHARALFERIRHLDGARHLSALMTPAHRADAIKAIAEDLLAGRPCRLAATQVVECGVDLDFPQVLRALAGLDSIIQAAGRCNRSGKPEAGRVMVFQPADHPTPPDWRNHAALAREALESRFAADPAHPDAVRWYFQRLYNDHRGQLDAGGVIGMLEARLRMDLSFHSASEAFRLIEESSLDVTVAFGPYRDEVRGLLARAEAEPQRASLLRALQRHTVRIRPREARALEAALHRIGKRVWVLDEAAYDGDCGVKLEAV